jgi:regulator of replication initiation timing
MHSGIVFWGEKAELRQMMTTLEQADVQVAMFETETSGWTLHVNFAGGEVSRLTLENDRLQARLAQRDALVHAARAVGEKWESMRGDYQSTGESVELAELLDDLVRAVREVGT